MAASLNFPKLPKGWDQASTWIEDGQILTRSYFKSQTPQKALFIIHGQGEQSDRYEHFPFYLQNHVDAIFLLDLPGHGSSKGVRGHIQSFDDYSRAVKVTLEYYLSKYPNVQMNMLGHSMGGLIALRTLVKQSLPIKKLSVSAPLLGLSMPVPKVKRAVAEFIAPVLGFLPLSNELDPKLVSHDYSVVEEYKRNKKNHGFVTPNFFINMIQEMEFILKYDQEFKMNIQFIVPLEDKIASSPTSIEYFKKMKVSLGYEKQLIELPQFYHEPFNEVDKEHAFSALTQWLEKPTSH